MKSGYDEIAAKYDERFSEANFTGIENSLKKFYNVNRTLEIGCGTGKWLENFSRFKVGLDLSFGMLKEAKGKNITRIIQADGEKLPFYSNTFDFVFIVNAIHFIKRKDLLADEISRILKSGGVFLLIFADVHDPQYLWYLYDYFPKVKKLDYSRFEKPEVLKNIFERNKFSTPTISTVDKVGKDFYGEKVFEDPFLKKHNSSQLAMLSEKEYESGIKKIEALIKSKNRHQFKTEIIFKSLMCKKIK